MATMTIAQALVSDATRISVADTAADIAAALPDPSLLARVASFTLDAGSVVSVAQAHTLLTLGSLFHTGGYSYTVADTVAALSDPAAAPALALATATSVVDSAANLLAAASSDVVLHAASTVLSSSATVSAPQLLMLEALPDFSVAPGQTITVADTLETIAALAAPIAAAASALPIVFAPTDSNVTLTADAAAALTSLPGLHLSNYGVSVADTGAAITADAPQLFGKGLASITVTSGVFSGTPAQMADPTLQYAAQSTTQGSTTGDLILTGGAQITTNTTLSTTQLLADTLQQGFGVANGVTLTVQDTAENLIANAAVVNEYAKAIVVTDSPTLTAAQAEVLGGIKTTVGAAHFSLGSNTITVSDNPAALTNPANAAGIALASALTLPSDSVANAAEALILANDRSLFSTGAYNLTVIDTASALVSLAGDIARAVNAWGGQVVLSGNATLSVASVEILQNLAGFGPGANQLTISDTITNLLAPSASVALAIATAVELSASATGQTVATATALTALHGYTADSFGLTVTDTPANLAGMSAATAAFVTLESFAARTGGNAAGYTISVAQLTALQALSGLTMSGFSGSYTVADTADTLSTLGPQLGSITFGSLLSKAMFALSANATTTATEAGNLANFPGFSTAGHSLTILDQPSALLSPGAIGGIALATSVGISGPAIVSASTAASLAALHNYHANSSPLTIQDTPAKLAAATVPALAIASSVEVAPSANEPIGDYTINATQFATMAGLANLSFQGFSGTITVLDSASALVGLANSMSAAAVGSGLLLARGAMAGSLSGNGTVTGAGLLALASLPSLALNGHALVVQDTPTALLADFPGLVPLATEVELAANGSPWLVTAANATRLAGMPSFNLGPAGMTVSDTAGAILATANAAGVAAAGNVVLNANATVTAANATSLYGLGTFSTGSASLTIQDGAGKLATLSAGAAGLASSILQQGSALVTVSQFVTLRSLSHFSTNGNLLVVADNATNLLTLAGSDTSLASQIVLNANATSLTAAQAETLATLPNFTPGTAQLAIVDSGADLLHITGAGPLPDDWAGELAATSVTLSGNATMTASQADDMALLGAKFSRGGFTLTVADTAANLLLPANAGGVALGTTVTLTGNETALSAAAATALAGIANFSKGGFTVTVSDSAANLLDPAYAAGITLSGHAKLATSATVSGAQAGALAALPNFALGSSVTLTVQDSVANLIGLSNAAKAVATSEMLTPGAVTVTAAQGAALDLLPHFSTSGATITVNDTVAFLNTYIAWSGIDASYIVTDTAANIAAATPSALITHAASVVLAGGADIAAATAGTLAGISTFSRGGWLLTVTDTAAAIAANATAILAVGATSARIDSNAPVGAAQAEALVPLSSASMLGFTAGVTLAVADSYANLTNAAYAGGIALASSVTVLDTLNNVLTAAAHNWGSITPFYALSGGGDITGAQATTLAALGSHLSLNGQTVVVTDTAAAVVTAAAALDALNITAQVTDTTAHVVAQVAGLIARGDRLTLVTLTDSTPITAAQADAMHNLASILAGDLLTVSDTAAVISFNVTNLLQFGSQLGSVFVTDTAADVESVTSGPNAIQGLGSLLHITLTDTTPVLAAIAAGLAPVVSYLAGGTSLAVTDTGAHIATYSSALTTLIGSLGTVTLSDGTTVNASVATGVAPLATHLGLGVKLSVSDTAAALVAASTALETLVGETRIQSIVASNDLAANIVSNASGLEALGATATVLDSSANVMTALDGLEPLANTLVTAIAFTDLSAPVLTMSVNTLSSDSAAIALFVSSYGISVHDLAANIQADLQSVSSTLVAHLSVVSSVVATDNGGISLTESRAVAAGVDNGVTSVMARFTGGALTVTGVLASQVNTVAGLYVAPAHIAVSDTASDIQTDLTSGSSALVAHHALISGITLTSGNTITLTEAQATAAGIGTLMNETTGLTSFVVTGVAIGQVATVAGLGVTGTAMTVTATGAGVQSDLTSGSSVLEQYESQISSIVLSDGSTPTISLSIAQITAASTVLGLTGPAYTLDVADTAANVQNDLALGATSVILTHTLGGITLTSGHTITLTEAEAVYTGVAAALNTISNLTSFVVTGVTIGQITAVEALGVSNTIVDVLASAAAVQADLTGGSSVLTAQAASIGSITLSDLSAPTITLNVAELTTDAAVLGLIVSIYNLAVNDTALAVQTDLALGASSTILAHSNLSTITVPASSTITLTESQAVFIGVAGALNATNGLTAVDVTGVTVGQVGTVAGLGIDNVAMAVTGTALAVQNDLASSTSALEANESSIASIALTDSGTPTITLTIAHVTAASEILALIGGSFDLAIDDSAAHVQADLASGASSVILGHAISAITLTSGSTITLTEAEATYSGVAAALLLTSGLTSFVVTGTTIGQIGTVLGLGITGTTIGVSASAADVQSDLTGGSSVLTAHAAALQSITLTDLSRPAITLSVAQLGTDATVLGKIGSPYYIAVSDTAAHVQSDLALGGTSNILAQGANLSGITLTSGTTITLTEGQAEFTGVSTALGVTTGLTSFVVTGVAVNQIATLIGYGITGTVLHVSDTAANVTSDLTGGNSVLEQYSADISVIALTGGPTTLTLSIAQITSAASVLALISSYLLSVSDTATNIQNDLALGSSSQIVSHHTHVSAITLTSGNTITLTESQATASFVAGALSFASGLTSFVVTNTLISQVSTVLGLGVTGTTIGIVDSAANVQSDLTGGSSVLTAHVASLQSIVLNDRSTPSITLSVARLGTDATVLALITPSSYHLIVNDTASAIQTDLALGASSAILAHGNLYEITLTSGATITLTESQAIFTGVAAALNLTSGLGSVIVTGVLVSQVATVANLNIDGVSIHVSDTAQDVQNDLTGGSSVLFPDRASIGSITLTDGGTPTITLSIAAVSGDSAVLAKIGSTYHLAIADTAAHVQSDLALSGSSVILTHTTSGITLTSGSTITLTEAEAVYSGVSTALVDTIGLTSFVVTGVAIGQITTVLGLGVSNTTVDVSTTGAFVQSDLTGGSPILPAHISHIGSITLTDSSAPTITLSLAQFEGDTAVLGLIASPYSLALSGSAAAVQSDLTSGSSTLEAFATDIGSITLTDGSTPFITMTVPQLVAAAAIIPLLGPAFVLNLSGTAAQVQADLSSPSPVLVANYNTVGNVELTDGGTPTITLTAAQLGVASQVLNLVFPEFNLQFNDTAANVQADLALGGSSNILQIQSMAIYQDGEYTLTGGTITNGNTITLTESEAVYSGVASILQETTGLTSFVVTGVTLAEISTVYALGVNGTSVNLSTTAAAVQSDLTGAQTLLADRSELSGITLTDLTTQTITLNVTQTSAATAVLALIGSTYHLVIADTASAVQTDLAAGASSVILAAAHLTGVTLTSGHTITLTESQAIHTGVATVLSETTGLTSFVVTGVAINQIATVLALGVTGTSVHVSSLAATVQADLTGGSSVLLADVARIGLITLTDGSAPTITLTVAQLAADASVLALIGSSFHIAINDTALNVQNDLALGASSVILENLSAITGITVPASSTITLTSAQLQHAGVDNSGSSAIAKISGLSSLVATQTLVANIGTVLGLTVPATAIQVKDSDANITGDINGAGTIAAHLSVITKVTTNETTLNAADASTIYTAVGSKFDESALTIADTASALVSAESTHPAVLAAAQHLTLSINASGVSAANATILAGLSNFALNSHTLGVADSYTNLLLSGNAAGIALATTVQLNAIATVTAQVATELAALHAFTAGPAITVQDTVADLLNASYATGLAIATTVELNASVSVNATQLAGLAAITGYTDGGFTLTLADTIANVLGLSQLALGFATTTAITDTTSHFTGNVAAIQAALPAHSHAFSITLTDPVAEGISVTAANYVADAATYAAITNANVIAVSGDAADVAAVASQIAASAAVGQVTVSDSAADILANLTALEAIGSKFTSVTITDTSVNASEVAALLAIPNLNASSLTISDTGTQIAAAIQADGTPGLTFLNSHTVTLSGDSVISAADALTLEELTSLSKNGYHLYVWDTASHLTDSVDGYLAAVSAGIIDAVYLKATGNTATISASLAATLLSISAFNRNDPPAPAGDGLANTLIVSDTAAHIDAVFSSLNAHRSALSSIVVSVTTTVSDQVFGDLLTLGATMAGGKTLTVRDTAANIIANAASQTSGSPSITPSAWQISGSASVAPSGAILLAGLTGFSIGAFTLTLNASATITVANANSLGALTTSLALGGNHLFVDGTVATMTTGPGLSSNAKLIVTPNITDTFSNIATLTTGSGLLGGTITITDSEAITTTQASDFLALLGGSGIPVANVSFGSNVESITDTLSNITTLTGSAGWTNNTSVHSDFSLVVADTVSVLTNASNTAALAGMHATTFSSNQTMLAATAETLFALENTIHFSKGSFTLTIQDTAANLLNPSNSDGVALADSLQLSASGTVAAADAETLLTNSHFSVNGHTLTVSDSSADLLDGILAGDIAGSGSNEAHVVVELQAAEVLDAGTATALVALPGFTNNGDLSIADGSSYLLAASAHTAETDATSVTLAGDETVSLATAKALSLLPNFSLQSNTLYLASNDFADAATLNAVASFGAGFNHNGYSITMTQDDLTLTPTQYTALQSDDVLLNGHALSAMPVSITVTSGAGTAHVAGTGIAGATLNVYAGSGSSLSTTSGAAASFTASASEGAIGNGMVVTETVGSSAATSESAPIIALEQTVLTNAATADSATFAGSGAVQIGVGQYANLYTTATAPTNPANPILVYDPTAHTLSLDITGHAATLLVTLGTATHPTALTAAEIFVQHFS